MKRILTLLLVLITAVGCVAQNPPYKISSNNILIGNSPTGKISFMGNDLRFSNIANGSLTDSVLTIVNGQVRKVPRSQFGSTTIFNNGVLNNNGTVGLKGGTNWTFDGLNENIFITDVNFSSFFSLGRNNAGFTSNSTTTTNQGEIKVQNESVLGGGTQLKSYLGLGWGVKYSSISVGEVSGMVVQDEIFNRGLVAKGNYEANYVPLSYTSKKYVDSLVAASAGGTPLTFGNGLYNDNGNVILKGDAVWETDGVLQVYNKPTVSGGISGMMLASTNFTSTKANSIQFDSRDDSNDIKLLSRNTITNKDAMLSLNSETGIRIFDSVLGKGIQSPKYWTNKSSADSLFYTQRGEVAEMIAAAGGSGTPLTFSDGLTKTVNNVKLGGVYNSDIIIGDAAGTKSIFYLGSNSANLISGGNTNPARVITQANINGADSREVILQATNNVLTLSSDRGAVFSNADQSNLNTNISNNSVNISNTSTGQSSTLTDRGLVLSDADGNTAFNRRGINFVNDGTISIGTNLNLTLAQSYISGGRTSEKTLTIPALTNDNEIIATREWVAANGSTPVNYINGIVKNSNDVGLEGDAQWGFTNAVGINGNISQFNLVDGNNASTTMVIATADVTTKIGGFVNDLIGGGYTQIGVSTDNESKFSGLRSGNTTGVTLTDEILSKGLQGGNNYWSTKSSGNTDDNYYTQRGEVKELIAAGSTPLTFTNGLFNNNGSVGLKGNATWITDGTLEISGKAPNNTAPAIVFLGTQSFDDSKLAAISLDTRPDHNLITLQTTGNKVSSATIGDGSVSFLANDLANHVSQMTLFPDSIVHNTNRSVFYGNETHKLNLGQVYSLGYFDNNGVETYSSFHNIRDYSMDMGSARSGITGFDNKTAVISTNIANNESGGGAEVTLAVNVNPTNQNGKYSGLRINDTNMLFIDNIHEVGAGDAADYSANKTQYSYATKKMVGDMIAASGGSGYVLPQATASVLGGVKIGNGIDIDGSGVISVAATDLSNYYNKTQSDARYELAFSKNTAFNKNFGTAAGTVTEGNDQRVLNGQLAFGWGNHATYNYYSPTNLPPSQVQNSLVASTTLAPSVTAVNDALATTLHTTGTETKVGRLILNSPTVAAGTSGLNALAPLTVLGATGGTNNATTGFAQAGNGGAISIKAGNGGGSLSSSGAQSGGAGGAVELVAGDGGIVTNVGGNFGGSPGIATLQAGSAGIGVIGKSGGAAFVKGGQNSNVGGYGGDVSIQAGYGNNNLAGSGKDLTYDGNIYLGAIPNGALRGAVIVGANASDFTNDFQVTGNSKFTGNVLVTSAPSVPTGVVRKQELDLKQDILVSAVNIKTINGSSIVGSGDLVISGGGSVANDMTPSTTVAPSKTAVATYIDAKVANDVTASTTVAPSKSAIVAYVDSKIVNDMVTSTTLGASKAAIISYVTTTANAKVEDNLTASTLIAPSKTAVNGGLALKENTANKQNALTVDGSGVKFPTVDAVNAGLATKVSSLSVVTANGVSGTIGGTATAPTVTLVLGAITPTTITPTGKVTTIASATGGSGFSMLPGVDPTTPVNGDVWLHSTAGLKARVNGVTQTYAPLNAPVFTGVVQLPTGTTAVTQTAGVNNTTLSTTTFANTAATNAANAKVANDMATSTTVAPSKAAVIAYLAANSVALSNYIVGEVPTGTLDGTNKAFTLSGTPQTGKEMIFINGVLQRRTTDYTISGAVVTFVDAPSSTNNISATYFK